jgi:hypothetical protein
LAAKVTSARCSTRWRRDPVLRGTIRGHDGGARRAFVRFFACEQDLSHEQPDAPLPEAVATRRSALPDRGAMAGG